jgi:hypothetical protein
MTARSSLLLLCALGAGCNIDLDWDPDFDFDLFADYYDAMTYPDDGLGYRSLDHAVPPGAVLQVELDEFEPEIHEGIGASSSDETTIRVEDQGTWLVTLRALSAGQAEVTFFSTYGDADETHTLRVEPVAEVELVAFRDGYIGAIDEVLRDQESAGLALRPGAAVTVGLLAYDREGETMSGADFFEWSYDEALLEAEPVEDFANSVRLRAVDGAGSTTVTADLGGELALHLLSEDIEPEVRLYEYDDTYLEIDAIEEDAGHLLLNIGAWDPEGRWVIPGEDDELTVTVLEGPEDLVGNAFYDPGLHAIFADGCPGSGVVEFAYAGGAVQIPVDIEEGPHSPDSCQ